MSPEIPTICKSLKPGLSILPDKARALLVLKEGADQTIPEITDIMHLDAGVVRWRLFAARQWLSRAAEVSKVNRSRWMWKVSRLQKHIVIYVLARAL